MKSILVILIAVIFMTSSVISTPIAEPAPDAVAEPFQFYGASQTATPGKRDIGKRELIVKRDDIIPEEFLTRRDLVRRTQSPTSGPDVNKCSPTNAVGGVAYTCGVGNDGPCCSVNGWCGSNSYYCGGGCQDGYGSCIPATIQLTYDADAGDSIWDISTDNVFDAEVGDGIIYYGATPTVGWPSKK